MITFALALYIATEALKIIGLLGVALAATDMLMGAFGGGGPTFRTTSHQRQESPHNTGD